MTNRLLQNLTNAVGIRDTPILVVIDGLHKETIHLLKVFQQEENTFSIKAEVKPKIILGKVEQKTDKKQEIYNKYGKRIKSRFMNTNKIIQKSKKPKIKKNSTVKTSFKKRKITQQIHIAVHRPTTNITNIRINENVKFTLLQAFIKFPDVDKVIILEDDLLVSPDVLR